MKIRISSQYLAHYDSKTNITPDEEIFITLLEDDEEFEKRIINIRKKYGIPVVAFPEVEINNNYTTALEKVFKGKRKVFNKETQDPRLYELAGMKDDYDLLFSDAKRICYDYDLPYYWAFPVTCFIGFGVLPIPSKLTSIAFYGKYSNHRWYAESSENVLIALEQGVSKKGLKDWIDKNWKDISREVSRLPNHPKSKMNILRVYQRMAYWKGKGFKPREIAKQLQREDPGWKYTYIDVGIYLGRYEEAIKKLRPKRDPLNAR